MKNFYIILLSLFVMLLFSSCSNLPISLNKKSDNNYYSKQIKYNFNSEEIETVTAFEVNYSKEITVNKDDANIINKFLSDVEKNSYITKPSDLPEKSTYKFFITFKNNEKFVIEVFNEKYVSIYPWDGNYSPDYIDMTSVHALYNLYGLCKYLFPLI